MTPPGPVTVEDVRQTVLLNPSRADTMVLTTGAERSTIDPVTGSRSFVATSALLTTADGVIVDPSTTILFSCEVCGRTPFTALAVVRCSCGRIVCKLRCLGADDHGPRCTTCTSMPWWKRVLRWLCQVPP